ncbi:sugar phosphate isomerase/epimerase [Azospirillum lipoferum]|uniref:Sugar phosphate isomerase/epimerase n=1 Tax=Azospirillum lipoferum TaxID=193 RepID=A0A5A9GK41_AZOLI|nr:MULTISPECIES: sugar phosphate isomerase/epimerase family protein [Azospirillum]KAA0594868.1 sugar phosphate isomerase/epimerase [Azospirillum lipoferum]MCP1612803.1 sugar phosphate isomerase/epimerase [Azospirillum lipoferum]MDW5532058.1 sugar phosphate isomerase/epimerase family protein [Azospirillum sp. NL1]
MNSRQKLMYHSLASKQATLAMDLDIARTVGFDGLETSGGKIRSYLDAGFAIAELKSLIGDTEIPGIGFLIDIERQGTGKTALMQEADALFQLADAVGARGVQVITGPLHTDALHRDAALTAPTLYRGLVGLPVETQIALTASNLRELADLAAGYGLLLYLESLSWTPLNTMDRQLRLIEKADRTNIRLVIDFWHCYTSGDTPDRLATLDKDLIYGVHVCDSLDFQGGIPDESVLRNVPTGSGVLKLKEWVQAVQATGYRGWWSCELFCRRQHQENSYEVARHLLATMKELIRSAP